MIGFQVIPTCPTPQASFYEQFLQERYRPSLVTNTTVPCVFQKGSHQPSLCSHHSIFAKAAGEALFVHIVWRMDHGEAIGMMAGAYFVGRAELLRWINDLTGLNYSKIEQTSNGIFACHVFDALFPGEVRMEKVNFSARQQYEQVRNYKVLQGAFNRLNLKKHVEVEKLMKGKYQDNLEFIQWVKAFYDSHASEDALNYDGRARREALAGKSGATKRPVRPTRPALAANRARVADTPTTRHVPRTLKPRVPVSQRAPRPAAGTVPKDEFNRVKAELEAENGELQILAKDNETERNFYFEKLRGVEEIIQDLDEEYFEKDMEPRLKEVITEMKTILYAEDGSDSEREQEEFLHEEAGDLVREEQDGLLSPGGEKEALLENKCMYN